MGNNNYQFRLQRLEILDKYIMALTKEKEHFNTFQFGIVNLHEDYAGSDEWNDVKHTRFKDEHVAAIQLACQSVNDKIQEACNALNQLKSTYANAGVI